MKNNKSALTLTIELWERLADTHECSTKAKKEIYTNICKENGIEKNSLPSHCFLCDEYYEEPPKEDYGMKTGCKKCPLYKAGYGCDGEDDRQGRTLFNQWCNSKEREEKHYAADVMLKALKAL